MQFASVLLQGGLRAQTAPKAGDGSGASAQEQQKIAASAIKMPLFFEANEGSNGSERAIFDAQQRLHHVPDAH